VLSIEKTLADARRKNQLLVVMGPCVRRDDDGY
jgi:hypothetical protein